MFQSFQQQTRALDQGAAKPFEDWILKGANVRIIGWAYNFGGRSVLCKTMVSGPGDLVGKKIRSSPNKVITECLRLMGASATPLAFGEVYTALQAGVLDGLEQDAPTVLASRFYEAAKFYALTEHLFVPLGVFMSEISLKRLDPNTQAGLLDASAKAALDTRAHGLTIASEALDMLKQKGVTVVKCDKEAFRRLVAPQTENFVKQHPDVKPIVEIVRSTYS
jgi:TRAP-type C4-dicarboxylate transport system substrate-binding protein